MTHCRPSAPTRLAEPVVDERLTTVDGGQPLTVENQVVVAGGTVPAELDE